LLVGLNVGLDTTVLLTSDVPTPVQGAWISRPWIRGKRSGYREPFWAVYWKIYRRFHVAEFVHILYVYVAWLLDVAECAQWARIVAGRSAVSL
jgi:hypothetical protein